MQLNFDKFTKRSQKKQEETVRLTSDSGHFCWRMVTFQSIMVILKVFRKKGVQAAISSFHINSFCFEFIDIAINRLVSNALKFPKLHVTLFFEFWRETELYLFALPHPPSTYWAYIVSRYTASSEPTVAWLYFVPLSVGSDDGYTGAYIVPPDSHWRNKSVVNFHFETSTIPTFTLSETTMPIHR